MEYISEAETKKVIEVVKNAKFYSLSIDGSIDEGCVEQKTLFVRVCNQGNMDTKFFTLGNPPQLVLQICMHLCWTITYRQIYLRWLDLGVMELLTWLEIINNICKYIFVYCTMKSVSFDLMIYELVMYKDLII